MIDEEKVINSNQVVKSWLRNLIFEKRTWLKLEMANHTCPCHSFRSSSNSKRPSSKL